MIALLYRVTYMHLIEVIEYETLNLQFNGLR